jgi:beta-glucanase (GH16 family)
MMRTLKLSFLLTAVLALTGSVVSAQNWQLVWQDEFTNSISSDWIFDIGTGSGVSAGGWGNNELQYYRQENATIENGQLVITARQEAFGGMNYTSARLKTQGKKSWTYGKIEARIAMPSFTGSWPGFWMLGSNIGSVSWPACGEIDIMEHINTNPEVHGTVHWAAADGSHASYGGTTNVGVTGYHVYTVEWTPTAITWLVDGAQYNTINIANGVGNTGAFHKDFYLLMNFAVGGNWPGFVVNNAALPAKMYVDYVRVYQDAGGGGGTPFTKTIEAEAYDVMSGIQTETCTDTGGGLNVGYIDTGDWLSYHNITIPTSGTYKVEYRVASPNTGGRLSFDANAGTVLFGYMDIPNTGGWQNWTTVSHNVVITAGTYNLGIYAQTGGWNLNWFRITKL